MDFKIPKKYTIGGQDIAIEIVESDGEGYGNYMHPIGRIRVCKKVCEVPQSETSQLNSFFHEFVHSILRTMGEYDLNDNEKFISCFAGFMTEAIRTME